MRGMLSRPADPMISGEPVPGVREVVLGTGARRIPGLVREDGVPADAAAAGGARVAAGKGPAEDQERSYN
ncbi:MULTISPECIES: hypothetical protein [unclassified Streptomyces]|uniref:hypothetical protein n=1 Tax=unclassified Streptomyces TaxID=2593676 RepID=UPI002E1139BD|nr:MULTISPECIES: hypothetical protein [unclassified Streptomyces]